MHRRSRTARRAPRRTALFSKRRLRSLVLLGFIALLLAILEGNPQRLLTTLGFSLGNVVSAPESTHAPAPLPGEQVLRGRVVKVSDGDTLTVLDAHRQEHKIRLDTIDAPESKQDFGQKAKQALNAWVAQKDVEVRYTKRDQYGRILGTVLLNGADINLHLVREGYAWIYLNKTKKQVYQQALQVAQREKRGLWGDSKKPQPPWEWRRANRR